MNNVVKLNTFTPTIISGFGSTKELIDAFIDLEGDKRLAPTTIKRLRKLPVFFSNDLSLILNKPVSDMKAGKVSMNNFGYSIERMIKLNGDYDCQNTAGWRMNQQLTEIYETIIQLIFVCTRDKPDFPYRKYEYLVELLKTFTSLLQATKLVNDLGFCLNPSKTIQLH